jgi:ZIP family zinc transporter
MLEVLIFSIINGSSVILGAIIGVFKELNRKTIAAFMAFGSGALICALTIGLMEEAFDLGGFDAVIIGFLFGGLLFIGGDYLIHFFGGRKHKQHHLTRYQGASSSLMIALGSALDGVPESIALGIALSSNQAIGFMLITAIFISNFPEGISSAGGLKREGFSRRTILSIWILVGFSMMIATILSFLFLHNLDPNIIGILEALAAGAILAMLTDSMMPEAYKDGGYPIGALTILGFLVAFIMSHI